MESLNVWPQILRGNEKNGIAKPTRTKTCQNATVTFALLIIAYACRMLRCSIAVIKTLGFAQATAPTVLKP